LTVHCGILPWNLDEFYYPEYKRCINELGIKLNYSAVSHLLGNSYAGEEGSAAVNSANPFNVKTDKERIESAPKPTMNMLKGLGLFK